MKRSRLGTTNLDISRIGLGTWAMGGGGWRYSWGPQDDAASIRTIQAAIDSGINWIDTAPVYGLGHAETIVGKAVHSMSSKPIIATKCGLTWNKKGKITPKLSAKSVREEVEQSLKRLGVDEIDLYQIHWPQPPDDIEEAWVTMADLMKEGKIRYAGVSNFNVSQLEQVHRIHPVMSLQPPYSMFERELEKSLLAFCKAHSIGIIAYSPLQKGLLTGKVTEQWVNELPQDDHRKKDPLFQPPQLISCLKKIENLQKLAKRLNVSMVQLAIAWTLRDRAVSAAIVGARSEAQIKQNVTAVDVDLNADLVEEIEAILT